MEGIMKTVKSFEEKGGFLSILLGILDAILLGNLFTGKGVTRSGERTIRERQDF